MREMPNECEKCQNARLQLPFCLGQGFVDRLYISCKTRADDPLNIYIERVSHMLIALQVKYYFRHLGILPQIRPIQTGEEAVVRKQ